MAELRWNPMIKDWVMIASNRQDRPNMPIDWCPFCPGSGKVPNDYDVYKYDNDFPALSQNPPVPDNVIADDSTNLYKVKESYGKCEVVLFSPNHNGSLCELSELHITKLVNLWVERFEYMATDEKIKYVFIFENRGETVGVSMPHPHGQIYGYSVIPKKIEVELDSCKEFYDEHNKCLFCQMNENESNFQNRVICENESFIAYIPFFSDYAYGSYILSKTHKGNISEFTDCERVDLAKILKNVTGAYDNLFDSHFPYMMCMHNAPINNNIEEYKDLSEFYHFHIEIYPPMRSANKQQFQAASETGVWAHCNPTSPEEKAEEMRTALSKFKESGK